MSKELKDVAGAKTVAVADIERFGEKVILPDGMTFDQAIDLLERRKKYDLETIKVIEEFDSYPWDAANALSNVLKRRFGFAPHQGASISVKIGPNESIAIPWGSFKVPNLADATLECVADYRPKGWITFFVTHVKRGYEKELRELFQEVRTEIRDNSIYRGKAMRIDFDSTAVPVPEFTDLKGVTEEGLIYNQDVHDAIETNLFTPIRRIKELSANKLPVKRGVLLGGTFGTGKTLANSVAAKIAVDTGVTHIHIPRANQLSKAIQFARMYQEPGCVIFCEDVDRVLDGDRDAKMDDLLNVIDGIDSKNTNIIVVLTTNEMEKINPAMLRAGRLDAVIEITPPDPTSVERLIRLYGKGQIPDNAALHRIGEKLAGHIPATIAEVVKRAKLSQLKLNKPGEPVQTISEAALLDSANSMKVHLDLLKKAMTKPVTIEPTPLEVQMGNVVHAAVEKYMDNGGGKRIKAIVHGSDDDE